MFTEAPPTGREHLVLTCAELPDDSMTKLIEAYNMRVRFVADDAPIDGSHFGAPEAGLIGNELILRGDTPVQSAMHEFCHYVCMTPKRRAKLHTDAGGNYDEENAVCYLQILLSDYIVGVGRTRMMHDMDNWGYSFRLGSTQAWFEKDAQDALDLLKSYHVLHDDLSPNYQLRQF